MAMAILSSARKLRASLEKRRANALHNIFLSAFVLAACLQQKSSITPEIAIEHWKKALVDWVLANHIEPFDEDDIPQKASYTRVGGS
jgi:hypothetical protein